MHDSLIGTVVDGRYAITALVGRGGMATVYRARDKRLERDVAIKLMHPHLAEKPDLNARFNKEARAAAQLTSPYVVAIHDQGVWASPDGPRAYLVMEYVPGPDARSELSRLGSFNLGTALELTRQVLRALCAAHAAGIVHRDVKPENILLTQALPEASVFDTVDIQAKVADFGLAHVIDADSAATGTILGTVAYIPPESVGSGKFDAPADLYSLGIMLYEFLTGTLPFKGETPLQTAYMHVNDPMPRVGSQAEWMPAQVDSFIAHLTAKKPADRPADALQALEEFESVCASIPEEALVRRIPVIPTRHVPAERREAELAGGEETQRYSAALPASPDVPAADNPKPASSASPHVPDAWLETAQITPVATDELPASVLRHEDSGAAHEAGHAQATEGDAPRGAAVPRTAALPHEQLAARQATTTIPRHTAPTRRRWPILLLVFAVLAAAGGAGAWYFLEGPGKRIEIPAVAGQGREQAEDALRAAGFEIAVQEAYSDEVAAGMVIASDPAAGNSARVGSKVQLTVSLGVEQVPVPSLTALTRDEALEAIARARLVGEVAEAYSESVEEGRVISQSLEAESMVDHDSAITITVSKGREPIAIPSVVGKPRGDAVAALENAGLLASVAEAYSDEVAEGEIISQEPASGTAYRGDTVKITVSLGPEMVEVPNVTDLSADEAKSKLEAAGLKAEESKPFGITRYNQVWMQNPTAGTQVRKGSSVRITLI